MHKSIMSQGLVVIGLGELRTRKRTVTNHNKMGEKFCFITGLSESVRFPLQTYNGITKWRNDEKLKRQ